jgi:hypothetical protein
VTPENAAKDEA